MTVRVTASLLRAPFPGFLSTETASQYQEFEWRTVPTRLYSRPKIGSHDFLKKYVYLPHRFNATSHTLDFLSGTCTLSTYLLRAF